MRIARVHGRRRRNDIENKIWSNIRFEFEFEFKETHMGTYNRVLHTLSLRLLNEVENIKPLAADKFEFDLKLL